MVKVQKGKVEELKKLQKTEVSSSAQHVPQDQASTSADVAGDIENALMKDRTDNKKEKKEQLSKIHAWKSNFRPSSIPIFGNLQHFPSDPYVSTEWIIEYSHLALKQGESCLRLWVGNLLYVYPLSGSALKPILESSVEISKGSDYNFFKAWLGNGLLLSDGAEWKAQRAMLTPTFHFTILNDFMQIFNRQTKILLEKMQEHADNGKMVDIYEMIGACSVDMIGEAGMGVELKTSKSKTIPT
uniref:Cytochrome P450 n=1 Tax=Ditylenchus dipsaci TaxID=166011 RepID=A0A915D208_9BILA